MKQQKYKFLEHTADIKFQAFGSTIEKAFENSALAMFNSMSEDKIKAKIKKKIKVQGKDNESLLYNFLEELLFLLDSENFFISKTKVKIKDFGLTAELWGNSVKNYETKLDVKAVTYNQMKVEKKTGRWVAQVVIDV
ncbi:MAG: archease [Candidatus Pacearchaeota archaeon]|nr:archease [Candidatus Pacearchaeota archaeon]